MRRDTMGLWKKPQKPDVQGKQIDIKQLTMRLKSIANHANIEVVQLAIQSIIDELEEKGA